MTPMFYFNRAIEDSDGDESKSVQGIVKQQQDGSWFVLLDVVKGDRDGSDGSPPIATPDRIDNSIITIASGDLLPESLLDCLKDPETAAQPQTFDIPLTPPTESEVPTVEPLAQEDGDPDSAIEIVPSSPSPLEDATDPSPAAIAPFSDSEETPSSAILWTGMGVGMAINFLAIAVGAYLLQFSGADKELAQLDRATDRYESGDVQAAIALAQSIPNGSYVYSDAQAAIDRWQQEWERAEGQFAQLQRAFEGERWTDAMKLARQLPEIDYWQQKARPIVRDVTAQLEAQADRFIRQAYDRAAAKDFTGALDALGNIPPGTQAYVKIQPKLAEYRHKQNIRADWLLQRAYDRAAVKDFSGAIRFIEQIPPRSNIYTKVQTKLAEYRRKQNVRADWLLQQAYDFAADRQFATAIDFLYQIPEGTDAFTIARTKIDEYAEKDYLSAMAGY